MQDSTQLRTACLIGIDFIQSIDPEDAKWPTFLMDYEDMEIFRVGDVYIRQLQGPSYLNGTAPNQIRWPLVLTQLIVEWSRQMGIPRVLMQPYEQNYWPDIRNNNEGRGEQRYNKTAERCGFSRNKDEIGLPYVWNNFSTI